MQLVYFLGLLPPNERPFALMFEEPTGNIMPSTLGIWTSSKAFFMIININTARNFKTAKELTKISFINQKEML